MEEKDKGVAQKFLKREGITKATIDFSDFADGVSCAIEDPTAAQIAEMTAAMKKPNASEVEISAAFARAYVKAIAGEKRAEVFNTELPAPKADLPTWGKWVADVRIKVVNRLIKCISAFAEDQGAEGNA